MLYIQTNSQPSDRFYRSTFIPWNKCVSEHLPFLLVYILHIEILIFMFWKLSTHKFYTHQIYILLQVNVHFIVYIYKNTGIFLYRKSMNTLIVWLDKIKICMVLFFLLVFFFLCCFPLHGDSLGNITIFYRRMFVIYMYSMI